MRGIQEHVAKILGSMHSERDGRIVQAFLRGAQLQALASQPGARPSPETVRSELLRSLVGGGRETRESR